MQVEKMTWREYLGKIILDIPERQRIASELNVNTITLTRWVSKESKPRPHNLRQLINTLPQHRKDMQALIAEEFPELFATKQEAIAEDQAQEIPSEFYTRVINAYLTTTLSQRFWAIANLILQQALGQLDSGQVGMALTVVQCMPPRHGNKVRSLHERIGRGTPPWSLNLEQQALFLGAESLAGYAVISCRSIVIQNASEHGHFPAHWLDLEESAAAYPIMRLHTIVGCLVASSTQKDFFLPARQALLHNYASLMALAFELEEFYPIQDIALQPMPHYRTQEALLSSFRQRVSTTMIEAGQQQRPIGILEAEQLVWQQLEEELLQLPSYEPDD